MSEMSKTSEMSKIDIDEPVEAPAETGVAVDASGSSEIKAAPETKGASEPKAPAGIERRQHARKPLRGNARLLLQGRAPFAVRTTDISAGGMGLVASLNMPPKVVGTIQFGLPAKSGGFKGVESRAVVALCIFSNSEDGFKIGLQFAGLPAPAATVITQFLNS